MIKKSSLMIYITILILILISMNSFMVITLSRMIHKDAETINLTGIIRGSIQRIAKLELQNINSDHVITNVDKIIADFKAGKLTMGSNSNNFSKSLTEIDKDWSVFKNHISKYRSNPDFANEKIFLYKSEQLWPKTNEAVLNAQKISEKKVSYFNYIVYSFIANTLLLVSILVLIRGHVINKLEYSVNYDFLTGIYNRSFYHEYLLKEIYKTTRVEEHKLSLVILDIDHFKNINDKYGHDVGDLVLKKLAKLISENIRKSDIFARIGGEEFALILTGTTLDKAVDLSEKIREIVANNIFDKVGHLTISLGVAELKNGDTIDTIYKRTGSALYKAKQNGRNRVEFEK